MVGEGVCHSIDTRALPCSKIGANDWNLNTDKPRQLQTPTPDWLSDAAENQAAGKGRIIARLAGTASGLMGFLQMAAAALGSFVVALLPYRTAFPMIALFGGFVALGLAAAVFAVRCTQPPPAAAAEEPPVLPGAPAPAAKFQVVTRG